ncbi:serine/threonine-protein kinase [Adhaeretor mobilis]|uniref:Serine/threonine-protein kinase PrkC n=1 Tax=Adhaeretor mobilis TaxID=1930276 RepID=A0A517MTC1_9BACT|nr:serine/threonine-protein kinase [Adhaeretor mobilis]QDS98124.1 Serine/threonine-protein kinase PrkC [Adhaeretor mobilis]
MATLEPTADRTNRASLSEATASATSTKSSLNQGARNKAIGRIGPWQLVRLLHEGELARVYLARPADSPAEQPAAYAVKVLRKEWWRHAGAIEMQRRSAWVGRRATHPNLLPVLSCGVQQPPFYVVSPRLEGESLAAVLQRERRLPLSVTLWIVRQVAEALEALHDKTGMVHGDVKPANVMLAPDGHATLIDFGFVHSPREAKHWATQPVFGTLNYIAPEVVASSLSCDLRADLYGLGVMLYEMLSGVLPHKAADAESLIRMHRETKPVCIRERQSETPKAVASLVHRLLAKDPLRRPESAGIVAEELVRLEIASFSSH